MSRTTLRSFLFAAIAAAMILAAPASADTITYTATPIVYTLTDWELPSSVQTISFQQFNSSLGTLQSVQLQFSGDIETTLTVTNNGISSSSGNVKTESVLTVQDVGLNLNAPELDMVSPPFSYTLAIGDSLTSLLLTSKTYKSDDTYTSSGVLTEFTGVGTFGLPATTFTQTLLANNGGNTFSSQVTDAELSGKVTYTYTPGESTPEPASMGLIGLGLAGLAFWQRRRTRAN